jgi:HEAT repeat protein
VEGLSELIGDADRDVRESVINALGQLADRRAVVPMVLALLDAETTVRSAAAATLDRLDRNWRTHEDLGRAVPKIIQALKSPDYWVRFSAGKLLEQLNIDPSQMPETKPVKPARAPAAAGAAANPVVGILADLLFDRDRDLRLAAAAAFGRLQDRSAITLLTAALRDTDAAVREAAQAALKATGPA